MEGYIKYIRDRIEEGKRSFSDLTETQKRHLLSIFIETLSDADRWEIIIESDKKNIMPSILSDILSKRLPGSFIEHVIFKITCEYHEEFFDEIFEEEINIYNNDKKDNLYILFPLNKNKKGMGM